MKNFLLLSFIFLQSSYLLSQESSDKQLPCPAAIVAGSSDQGDGSYHLMNKDHWTELQSRTFNIGDIIITSKELQERVKYSVHGNSVRTEADPTNAEHNWSTIVKAGTVTLASTLHHGHSEARTEKTNITVK